MAHTAPGPREHYSISEADPGNQKCSPAFLQSVYINASGHGLVLGYSSGILEGLEADVGDSPIIKSWYRDGTPRSDLAVPATVIRAARFP